MVTLFGIKNCDTVKKARQWLEQNNVEHCFHDFREDGINSDQVNDWLSELGWQTLVNKRSTSWKQLDPAQREAMNDSLAAKAIMEQPTLIKRPLLDLGNKRCVGFKAADYQAIFNS